MLSSVQVFAVRAKVKVTLSQNAVKVPIITVPEHTRKTVGNVKLRMRTCNHRIWYQVTS